MRLNSTCNPIELNPVPPGHFPFEQFHLDKRLLKTDLYHKLSND